MPTFEIGESDFLLDGRPHRIISGALHYFRVHPEQWRERIRMGRMMGLNTIETYVAWNEHAPDAATFDTSGRLDLARFLREVQAEGMHAIVRPGPYICAEFDGGGLPGWLFRPGAGGAASYGGDGVGGAASGRADGVGGAPVGVRVGAPVGVRSREPQYLAAVTDYLRQVMQIVAPLQIDRGGPVILLQVENEYGAYGSDHGYLAALVEAFRAYGATVPLTTVDQPDPTMLAAGTIPGLLATASFGSRATERMAVLRRQQPTGPLMCSEFWCGWFDHWGAHHHTTDAAAAAGELDDLLATGASVNIYMLHGGTNFALTNGANDKGVYQPTVTSYDYDAPLDEAGRPTEKFWAFREVIGRYTELPGLDELGSGARAALPQGVPAPAPFVVPAPAELQPVGTLEQVAPAVWTAAADLPTMDDLGCWRGFVRYRTVLDVCDGPGVLAFGEVRDRAWVSLDGTPVGVLARDRHENTIVLPRGHGVLELLVEDMGRVNYGPRIGEPKGLIGPATFTRAGSAGSAGSDGGAGGQGAVVRALAGWHTSLIDLEAVVTRAEAAPISASPLPTAGATLFRAVFHSEEPRDLVLSTDGLGKGLVWVNGFCLGRYWRSGPQRLLFVPGPVTRAGANTVIVLELEAAGTGILRFLPDLDLGHTDS